jgi:hypothetical protein
MLYHYILLAKKRRQSHPINPDTSSERHRFRSAMFLKSDPPDGLKNKAAWNQKLIASGVGSRSDQPRAFLDQV